MATNQLLKAIRVRHTRQTDTEMFAFYWMMLAHLPVNLPCHYTRDCGWMFTRKQRDIAKCALFYNFYEV